MGSKRESIDFAGGSRSKRNRDIRPLDDSEGNENVYRKKLRLMAPLEMCTEPPLGDITNCLGSSCAAENANAGNKVNESLTTLTPSMSQVKADLALPGNNIYAVNKLKCLKPGKTSLRSLVYVSSTSRNITDAKENDNTEFAPSLSMVVQFDISNSALSASEMPHVQKKPIASTLQLATHPPGSLRATKTRRSHPMPPMTKSSKIHIEKQFDLAGSSRTTHTRRCRPPPSMTESSKKNIEKQIDVPGF
ncbi:hypothetical protein RIF29_28548 [Crotalaria pallida]|uniref:Uncharacterized protein n=1 Tax=Crotalaria pallida TaxID=3830 RepID=A0AAN9HVG1_CROPI